MIIQTPQAMILEALSKERAEVYAKLKQIDRVIKQVREGNLSAIDNSPKSINGELFETSVQKTSVNNGYISDIKLTILSVFDRIGKVSKLRHLQDEYAKVAGNNLNIREAIRTLNRSKKVRLMKEKGAERGIYWVKADWIEDGRLKDEYKPDGFDLLYDESLLEYV